MNVYIEDLVKEAKLGSSIAKEELINNFRPFIVKKAQNIFIKNYEIEDLIQIGYFSIIKAIESYKLEKKNFVAYVTYAITNNFNYEIRKMSKHRFESSLNKETEEGLEVIDLISDHINIEEQVIKEEELEKLYKAFGILTLEERRLIKIIYFKNVKIKEYSEIKGLKYGTVLKRKRVAIEKLKKYLKELINE